MTWGVVQQARAEAPELIAIRQHASLTPLFVGLMGLLVFAALPTAPARAGPFPCGKPDPKHPCNENPFADYGQQANICPGNPKGVCAAAEAVNSFVFLAKMYPKTYAGLSIDTGTGKTPTDAVAQFANGWNSPQSGKPIPGYYTNLNSDPAVSAQSFLATKQAWFDSFAPGTTSVQGHWGLNHPAIPNKKDPKKSVPAFDMWSFLANEIKDHEDVELFLYPVKDEVVPGVPNSAGHAVDLIGIASDAATSSNPSSNCSSGQSNCMIEVQDPNFPAKDFVLPVLSASTDPKHPARIDYLDTKLNPTDPNDPTLQIYAAFSESPKSVPAPAMGWTLMLAGASILTMARRRKTKGKNCSVCD